MGARTVPFIPCPGAGVFIQVNGITVNGVKFSPKGTGEAIDVTNSNSPVFASANNAGTIHAETLPPSIAKHQIAVSMPRDQSAIGYQPMVGDQIYLGAYYAANFGWYITGNVIDVGGDGVVSNSVGQCEFTCESTGLVQFV